MRIILLDKSFEVDLFKGDYINSALPFCFLKVLMVGLSQPSYCRPTKTRSWLSATPQHPTEPAEFQHHKSKSDQSSK